MQLAPFLLDEWLAAKFSANPPIEFDLGSSTGPVWKLRELLALEGEDAHERLLDTALSYTDPAGSAELRCEIAMMQGVDPDHIQIVTGAAEALLLLFYLAAEPGANVVLSHPGFPSNAALAESLGIEVRRYCLRAEDGFRTDLDEIQRLVDPRTDPTGLQGNAPTTYELYTASGMALIGHAEDNLLSLRMGVNRISYDPLQGSQGPIETTDRDNNELYGDVDFRHTFSPRRAVYAKIRPNTRNYDLKFDQSGFQRGSNGVRIDAGVDWDIDSIFLVNLETGIQHQSYDDSRFGNINQPDGRISLSWVADPPHQREVELYA